MRLETIVVGTDGSQNAQLAIDAAADLAEWSGASVHVVCAFDPISSWEYQDILHQLPEEFRSTYDPSAKYQQIVDEAIASLDLRGIAHEGHLIAEHPVQAIIETAERLRADLIVVGSRGRGWATRAFRGSVSSRVAAHAPGSVFIVHEPAEEG